MGVPSAFGVDRAAAPLSQLGRSLLQASSADAVMDQHWSTPVNARLFARASLASNSHISLRADRGDVELASPTKDDADVSVGPYAKDFEFGDDYATAVDATLSRFTWGGWLA
jgi:hypothetical protein